MRIVIDIDCGDGAQNAPRTQVQTYEPTASDTRSETSSAHHDGGSAPNAPGSSPGFSPTVNMGAITGQNGVRPAASGPSGAYSAGAAPGTAHDTAAQHVEES